MNEDFDNLVLEVGAQILEYKKNNGKSPTTVWLGSRQRLVFEDMEERFGRSSKETEGRLFDLCVKYSDFHSFILVK